MQEIFGGPWKGIMDLEVITDHPDKASFIRCCKAEGIVSMRQLACVRPGDLEVLRGRSGADTRFAKNCFDMAVYLRNGWAVAEAQRFVANELENIAGNLGPPRSSGSGCRETQSRDMLQDPPLLNVLWAPAGLTKYLGYLWLRP